MNRFYPYIKNEGLSCAGVTTKESVAFINPKNPRFHSMDWLNSKFKIERHPEATAEGSSQLEICEDSSLRLPARSRIAGARHPKMKPKEFKMLEFSYSLEVTSFHLKLKH